MPTTNSDGPIRIVMPFKLGGFSDTIMNNMLPRFTELLGTEVRIEYDPGRPGGCVAPCNVSKAVPNGKTLLIGTTGNITLLPAIYPNYGINPLTDLTPITLLAQAANILVTRPGLGADDFAGLIALAKEKPGELTYNPINPGSIHYVEMLTLEKEAGIRLAPAQFGGNPYEAVMAGEIDIFISTPARTYPRLASGEMIGIAVMAKERVTGAPNLPTFPELGIPSLHTGSWTGLFGPPGMDAELAAEIASTAKKALVTTDGITDVLDKVGMSLDVSASPEMFQSYLESETERLAKDVAITRMPVLEDD